MGGRVLFALSIAAFPEGLPTETLGAVFAGASAKVREAGGVLAGGHTIRDPEPKYGLAVTGAGHPDRLLRKGAAQSGDLLLLTKRLGTGLLVSGRRQGRTSEADFAAAIDQMRVLNRAASEVLVAAGVRAATDVTGFGLLGHGLEMARGSGTRFVFEAAAMPLLDGALDLARAGVETGGAAHNRRFVAAELTVADDVPPELVTLAHDPQTSGGLLAAVGPDLLGDVESALTAAAVPHWRVGRVESATAPGVALR
jgi:selenide,water dikinase